MSRLDPSLSYRWISVVVLATGYLALWADQGRSEETVRAFRRVLVPAESPETWPRAGKSLLPVESSEFEGWLETINEPRSSADILEAEYHARFEAGTLVDTHGYWRVALRGKRAAQLPLDGVSHSIRAARWRGGEAAGARLGWWPTANDANLIRALEVPASGVLDFEWSAIADPVDEALRFHLDLPAAARTKLVLELPAEMQPIVESGVIVESPTHRREGGIWVLALQSAQPQVLRIEKATDSESSTKSAIARQSTRYAIGRAGLDLEATFDLSARESMKKSVVVHVPAGLSVVSVKSDHQSLPWHVLSQPAGRAQRVAIEVPKTPEGRSASVTLRAWGPLIVDVPQRLPMPALRDVFWTAGEIEVVIDDSLELRQVAVTDCIETAVEVVDSEQAHPRQLRFVAYTPQAAVEVSVRHRKATGNVQTGVSLELGNSEIAGQIVSRIRVASGRLHQLTATVHPGWVIDAVETVPAEVLGEWYVDRDFDPYSLRLQLDSTIAPDTPATIVTRAHFSELVSDLVSTSDLNPLRWRHLTSDATLLELLPAEQYDLDIRGRWNEITSNQLSTDQRELVLGADGARSAEIADEAAATIRLVPKRIAYDATVQIDALLLGERCELSYDVECSPQGGGIDHALLFFSEPPATAIQWIDGESNRPLKAEKMPSSDPRFGGLPDGGELWRLEFGRLYARPIKISARQSIPWNHRQSVPLVSLPDAASQQGRITVASAGGAPPAIVTSNMTPAPLPLITEVSASATAQTEVRAVYRFQPTRLYDASAVPQLWIGPADGGSDARPVITHVALESRYAADGSGVHRAVYQINNQGAAAADLRFSEGATVVRARVDGSMVSAERAKRLALPLSPRKREVVAEVEFTSHGSPLENGKTISSPLPLTDCALLAGEWTIELPHGFAASDHAANSHALGSDWCERLFGPLARRSNRPFNPLEPSDWNELWIAASGMAVSPAEAATDDAATAAPGMSKGTATYRFVFGTTPLPLVTVVHRPAKTAWALAVFMLCAMGGQIAGLRLSTRLWLVFTSAAISLLLPTAWASLATAATFGFAAAAVWQWVQPRAASRAMAVAIIVVILLNPAVALAAIAGPTIESVLVPVDADGKPVGTKCYVTADFLRQLLAQSQARSESTGWLLTDMRCEGQLLSGTGQEGLATEGWVLSFEIDVLERDVAITLPLIQAEARWRGTASVDGIPAAIAWNDAGRGCTIRVAEPGPHRVSIVFEPRYEEAAARRGIVLTLPPIAGAKVNLLGPREIADVASDETPFARRDEAQKSVWQGELQSPGRLTVNWPIKRAAKIGEVEQRVTQISRLELTPESIVLDLQLVKNGGNQWPETIQIAVEPGWRLVASGEYMAEDVGNRSDGRQLLSIQIPSTERSHPQLALQFVSTRLSPLGSILPPEIEPTSISLERRWLAVTCDSSLECVPSVPLAENALPSSDAPPLDSADGRRPSVTVDLDQIEEDWHLAVRPAATSSTFRGRLSIAAGKDRFRVNYRSDVNPQGADRFGGSLAVPAELSIDAITATEIGESIGLKWVRVEPCRVNFFFDQRMAGAYRLDLRGELPMPTDGLLSVPRIAPLEKLDTGQTVALYRYDNVSAEWRFPDEVPWVESGASLATPFDRESHFVRAFPIDATTDAGVQVAVERSAPVLSGETLTDVIRGKTAWEVVWGCRLQVDRGTVDRLQLQLPDTCSGPFEVTPAANVHLAEASTANGSAILTLRLPQAVQTGDMVRLVVRSPLAIPDGQPVSAPRIRLLADGTRNDYLSLPTELDGEAVSWTRTGVEPSKLSKTLRATPSQPNTTATYRIHGGEMGVTLRPQPARADLASVRLAETVTSIGSCGGNLHVTRFWLSPAGLDHCDLRLHDGQTLVRLSVDGRSALRRALGPDRIQLQLGHTTLPQIIDVVTQSASTEDHINRLELAQPVLEQSGRAIPIDLSLWTLRGNLEGRRPKVRGGTLESPAMLASLRLDWLTSISQNATRAALDVPAVDGYSWFVRWASELRVASGHAERARQISANVAPPTRVKPALGDPSDDAKARSAAWIEQMMEFFRMGELPLSDEEQGSDAVLSPVRSEPDGGENEQCFVSDGSQGPLVVEFEANGLTPVQARYFALGSLALVAVVAGWVARNPRARKLAESWPEFWGLLIGIAAWAWLRPSLVGWAIAAVSVSLLLRRAYREKKSPRHGSSKRPTSIPEEQA